MGRLRRRELRPNGLSQSPVSLGVHHHGQALRVGDQQLCRPTDRVLDLEQLPGLPVPGQAAGDVVRLRVAPRHRLVSVAGREGSGCAGPDAAPAWGQWTKAGDEGRKMVPLKTGQKAWRTIDLDPFTVAVVERQIEMVEAERRQWGADYRDHRLIFPREDGSPQDPDWVTTKFERLAEKCPDVPRIVFHGMRHTHATLLLEDGLSLKVVAERLGDRGDTVVELYGHVTPRGRALAVASVGT